MPDLPQTSADAALTEPSDAAAIAEFLARVATPAPQGRRGRLMFALDATMSRQRTWDTACRLQAEMFQEAGRVGGLDIQLVYFRGFGECRATKWIANAEQLAALMSRIDCRGGHTQIGRVLTHGLAEARRQHVSALVYVGDAMEENADALCEKAGELALLNVPVFLFQEGRDAAAEATFREIARMTRGAWCRFDGSAARELAALLRAVAAYAAGGRQALAALAARDDAGAKRLIGQVGGG